MPLDINRQLKDNGYSDIQTKKDDLFIISDAKFELSQIVLPYDVKEEINNIIGFYLNREIIFNEWGLNDKFSGKRNVVINLYGESGTGKTMTAHALAHALNKKIIIIDYSSIESKYVGETSKNLVKAFKFAEKNNAILFFDEADALLSRRVTDMSSSTDISVNQTKSVLLGLLNDYSEMVIFTTNFISNYDSAFMRRIQYHIKFELPDYEQRKIIWNSYIPDRLPTDVNCDVLAQKYDGVSGSDISNAVFKAVVRAVNNNEKYVEHNLFCEEIEKIIRSKDDNKGNVKITTREVSEEYALEQIVGGKQK